MNSTVWRGSLWQILIFWVGVRLLWTSNWYMKGWDSSQRHHYDIKAAIMENHGVSEAMNISVQSRVCDYLIGGRGFRDIGCLATHLFWYTHAQCTRNIYTGTHAHRTIRTCIWWWSLCQEEKCSLTSDELGGLGTYVYTPMYRHYVTHTHSRA